MTAIQGSTELIPETTYSRHTNLHNDLVLMKSAKGIMQTKLHTFSPSSAMHYEVFLETPQVFGQVSESMSTNTQS